MSYTLSLIPFIIFLRNPTQNLIPLNDCSERHIYRHKLLDLNCKPPPGQGEPPVEIEIFILFVPNPADSPQ